VPRRSSRIARAFAQLYGHADLIVSTDRLSFNPPERDDYVFPGPHLHWDGNLTAPMPFETQAILYLTDTAADQGALQVVRGFHRRLAAGWIDTLDGTDPRRVDLSREAETVPAEAGDLVIWRHEIPHGASANRSDRPRLAQYVNYYPMHWPDERTWL
jgi:ectoine hydroxylase-related dioxygenase (phytanoyl-CoA dioxygenase family)